jgi:hypothetical protein
MTRPLPIYASALSRRDLSRRRAVLRRRRARFGRRFGLAVAWLGVVAAAVAERA